MLQRSVVFGFRIRRSLHEIGRFIYGKRDEERKGGPQLGGNSRGGILMALIGARDGKR